jgi:hypothetical protein
MKTIKHLFLILLIISLVIQLQSCYDPIKNTPCADTQYRTRNISQEDLSKVPYTGFDTLYFLNKQGDTCIVRGTGKQFSYEIEDEFGNPACDPTYRYSNQIYSISFIAVKGNLDFKLTQSYFYVIVERGDLYSVDYQASSFRVGLRNDSIVLKGVNYRQIVSFLPSVKLGLGGGFDYTYSLLYNSSYGVLYIKSEKENEEFSIIPKP